MQAAVPLRLRFFRYTDLSQIKLCHDGIQSAVQLHMLCIVELIHPDAFNN